MDARQGFEAMFAQARSDAEASHTYRPAPWTSCHGGRKAEAFTSADAFIGETALYQGHAAPDGAMAADRANMGWSSAWARRNTTRAGKSERKSMLVGTQRGARRNDAEGWPTYKPINGMLS